MRVALVSANAQARDAIGNHLVDKVRFFVDRHADVHVYLSSLVGLHPSLATSPSSSRPLAVAVETWSQDAWADLISRDLVLFEFSQDYDLLHLLPAIAMASPRPRVIVDFHGISPPLGWNGPTRDALDRGLSQRGLLWCADHVLVHSQWMKRDVIEATGLPSSRIHVVPVPSGNIAELSVAAAKGCVNANQAVSAPYALFVGRIAVNKNLPCVIEALSRLPARWSRLRLLVVGDTGDQYATEAARCRSLAHQLGVSERVEFLGQVDEAGLAEIYRRAEVLVVPSRHEGFCVPLVEAMASGVPVLAARGSAMTETLGDAGFSFDPDNSGELVRGLERVLDSNPSVCQNPGTDTNPPSSKKQLGSGKIAFVAFRFGSGIVGGAEASLAKMAQSLRGAGFQVEVFTTCTRTESNWRNDLPEGTIEENGIPIHRFAVDSHDPHRFHEIVREMLQRNGKVSRELEEDFLRHGIHSAKLLEALARRQHEFDAIVAGPYLFALTADVATRFRDKTIVVPCFHQEPFANLAIWRTMYERVGGWWFHSPEEKDFAQGRLGLNHPNSPEIGTWISMLEAEHAIPRARRFQKPFVVYAGRYSAEKNVPLLLDWLDRYQTETPGQLDVVFLGRGALHLPRRPWLYDMGQVDEDLKRTLLEEAKALVQLSTYESLSLVALEAWAARTPVIVHRECAVLAGQIDRSGGGLAVGSFQEFAAALDACTRDTFSERGHFGYAYVRERYGSEADFRRRMVESLHAVRRPIREVMIEAGRRRAKKLDLSSWIAEFERQVLGWTQVPVEPRNVVAELEPCVRNLPKGPGSRWLPLRVHNRGTMPILAEGPNRCVLRASVSDDTAKVAITNLISMVLPNQSALILVEIPGASAEAVRIELRWESANTYQEITSVNLQTSGEANGMLPLQELITNAQNAAREAQRRYHLPTDYLDVTEGWWAGWKRWIKKKLLNNFKNAYVDVLSRQQSRVNQELATAVLQMSEVCLGLDQIVRALQAKMDANQEPVGQEGPPSQAEVSS